MKYFIFTFSKDGVQFLSTSNCTRCSIFSKKVSKSVQAYFKLLLDRNTQRLIDMAIYVAREIA